MLGAARALARYDINVIGINRGNGVISIRTTPCSNYLMCWKGAISPTFSAGSAGLPTGPPEAYQRRLAEVVLHPGKWRI